MAWTLLLGFVALTLVFVWMLLVRYRIGALQDLLGTGELDSAIRQRQAEGMVADGVEPGPTLVPRPRCPAPQWSRPAGHRRQSTASVHPAVQPSSRQPAGRPVSEVSR